MRYEFRFLVTREHYIRYDGRTSIDPPSEYCVTHTPVLQFRSVDDSSGEMSVWQSIPTETVDQDENGRPWKGKK